MKKSGVFAILIACAFSACKKDKSATEILTSHPWALEKKYKNEVELLLHPCEKDNVYHFKSGGNFFLDAGDEPCYIGEAESYTGIWELNPEQTRMNVVYPGNNLTYNLITVSSGKLEIQYYLDTMAIREVYKQK